MRRYYPKNRIKPNQSTAGGELLLDGQDYVGTYCETFTGEVFSGASPDLPDSRPLTRVQTVASPSTNTSVTLTQLTPHYPVPTEQDYERGYFYRYFARRVTQPYLILEISKEDYDRISGEKTSPSEYYYSVTRLFWRLRDTAKTVGTLLGVKETNKRLVDGQEKIFPGIAAYIGGDYTRFRRI